jgi:aldehyde dehydrogenase (NAD+)
MDDQTETINTNLKATGEVNTSVAAGSSKDVDLAVEAAKKVCIIDLLCSLFALNCVSRAQAYKTTWGLKCPGNVQGSLLNKIADLVEANKDEFAALEALDVGE